jgi:hypothetical protein
MIQAFFLFFLGIGVTLFIVGCSANNTVTPVQSSQDQPSVADQSNAPLPANEGQISVPNSVGPSGGYNGYNNTTDREAMRQNSIDACNGMNENDTCQITFGNRTMSGTCRSFNDTLSCTPVGSGRMRGSGNYTGGNYRNQNPVQ